MQYAERLQQLMANLPEGGASRLEHILDRTATGSEVDLRTPLYDEKPYEEIIEEFSEQIGTVKFSELAGIDQHEKDNIGPYSRMLPAEKRYPNLKKYWSQRWSPDQTSIKKAFDSVCRLLPARSLRPTGFEMAFSMMPKDTSLGLPHLTKDRANVGSYLERAKRVESPSDIYPCVWYWRGQPKGVEGPPKQRDVWGFDHAETILGATILYPCLNALRRLPGFSSWLRAEDVDREATNLLNQSGGRLIISLDYSSFDSSLARSLLDLVDEVLKYWFVDSVHERISLLGEVSATVPIVVPYDIWDGRNGGMPSGSVLTNLRDTLANLLAGFYCAYRNNTTVDRFMVLGDDAVYLFGRDIEPDVITDTMNELGLTCNPEKQFISRRSLHYLQRWHSLDYQLNGVCVGVHSPYRTASGLFGIERFKQGWNEYMYTARWIMQVENCKWDPRFLKLVKFVYHGDKVLSSGMDPEMVFRKAGGSDKVRSVLELSSFPFNARNPDDVPIFETTRVIRMINGGRV